MMRQAGRILRILTYHRVAELDAHLEGDPRLVSATPADFASQMRYLARHFRVISMPELLSRLQEGRPLPDNAVLLTFDDGYVDFAGCVWPLLQKLGMPATLFVPTGFPGREGAEFWWDRLHRAVMRTRRPDLSLGAAGTLALQAPQQRRDALRSLQNHLKTLEHETAMALVENVCEELGCPPPSSRTILTWDALRALAKAGVTLGAHTVSHPIMNRLTADRMRWEVRQSLADLQREIGAALPIFCYPAGGYDDTVVEILRQEGCTMAFTTQDDINDLASADWLRLARTNITRRTRPALFRLRMQPWFARIDRFRHRRSNPALQMNASG